MLRTLLRAGITKERQCVRIQVKQPPSILSSTERLVAECGVVADHLLSSCLSISACVDFDGGTRTRTKCHTGNRSLSAVSDTEEKDAPLFEKYPTLDLPYTSGFFSSSLFYEQFSFLMNGDSLQAEGEPLHPNQTAERTSAH